MVKPVPVIPGEQHFILSSVSPSRAQKRLALVLVLALLVAWLITDGALSTIQLGRIDAFVPAYATAMFVNDSITAVLLFAQFSILRSRALLAIASGSVFTALVVIAWLLTFPGVFAPTGLLGAGLNSMAGVRGLELANVASTRRDLHRSLPAVREKSLLRKCSGKPRSSAQRFVKRHF